MFDILCYGDVICNEDKLRYDAMICYDDTRYVTIRYITMICIDEM